MAVSVFNGLRRGRRSPWANRRRNQAERIRPRLDQTGPRVRLTIGELAGRFAPFGPVLSVAWLVLLVAGVVPTAADEPARSSAEPRTAAATPAVADGLQRFEFREQHMGVDVTLTLYTSTEAVANDAAQKAFGRIADLNRTFSDYDADSEAMRLCRMAIPGVPQPISGDLRLVLEESLALSQRSHGAFDVTISPLIKLWRRARRQKQLPDAQAIAEARKLVDFRQIAVTRLVGDEDRGGTGGASGPNLPAGLATIGREGMQLDFGGIVKGFAAQEALLVLREQGIRKALVSLAGDIAAGDAPPGKPGWKIGVAPLDRPDGPPSRWLRLKNTTVSTSGDAFQFVEIDGIRYSHIVDPQTGLGLTRRSSVTVIASRGIVSDSLATAATVLGPEAGLKLIAGTPGAAGLIVVAGAPGEPLSVQATPGFREWEWSEDERR